MRKEAILFLFFGTPFLNSCTCPCPQGAEKKGLSLLEIRIRDPFILADPASRTYYLYAQRGNRQDVKDRRDGVECYTSRDLKYWQGPQPVFTVPDDFWAGQAVWAPEVHPYKGRYYLFVTFTVADPLPALPDRPPQQIRGTQVLVADSPAGPFKSFANRPHTPLDWMALDGTLWIEDNLPWMIFCHEWIQTTDGTMELVRLRDDLSAPAGRPLTLFAATDASWVKNLKDLGTEYRGGVYDGYVTDGPFVYRTKTGKLLMIWSSFGEEQYAVGIAESRSGKIAGPWKQQEKLLFKSNGGHAMIFRTFEDKLMLVLHQPNSGPLERAKLFELVDTGDTLRLRQGGR